MSMLVSGYLLAASDQAAIAQKATSFTLNLINMASYDAPGCVNQCRSFEICE